MEAGPRVSPTMETVVEERFGITSIAGHHSKFKPEPLPAPHPTWSRPGSHVVSFSCSSPLASSLATSSSHVCFSLNISIS